MDLTIETLSIWDIMGVVIMHGGCMSETCCYRRCDRERRRARFR